MESRNIKIPNMSCDHCVRTLETELSELKGVNSVVADLSKKTLAISIDDTITWDNVVELLKEINYPPAD